MTNKHCDHENCSTQGEYRAPKSRIANDGYYYFCIDHIRLYNKQWDYFKGMSPDEIMAHRISDITWRRPTYTVKQGKLFMSQFTEHPLFEQPIGVIQIKSPGVFPLPPRNSVEFKAIKMLDLEYPFSAEGLKKNYFKLVKKHHPDTNAGCKKSEETLKKITVAYKALSSYMERY
ncbi:MAG: J domain-containing protein [Alphaproteobacteria bacterium]|uniref:Chaperone protein DnaJ n=1 Tax=Candidatus Bodocaedibacter vickermanii TaxID=2741701 RepID=A0A7L9RU73_9PROT|nr:J domain-containing protein [Alphaproteobacteria bacterium]QOL20106.1 Chaperone protein DnaJ [Candidatus Paracaedibacteraceae bacterium 'Lake Konstanz']